MGFYYTVWSEIIIYNYPDLALVSSDGLQSDYVSRRSTSSYYFNKKRETVVSLKH